jgi:hypothetical protein
VSHHGCPSLELGKENAGPRSGEVPVYPLSGYMHEAAVVPRPEIFCLGFPIIENILRPFSIHPVASVDPTVVSQPAGM